jgi:hypothetical protein
MPQPSHMASMPQPSQRLPCGVKKRQTRRRQIKAGLDRSSAPPHVHNHEERKPSHWQDRAPCRRHDRTFARPSQIAIYSADSLVCGAARPAQGRQGPSREPPGKAETGWTHYDRRHRRSRAQDSRPRPVSPRKSAKSIVSAALTQHVTTLFLDHPDHPDHPQKHDRTRDQR